MSMLYGISMISIGKATLIFDINPMLTIVFACILLGERIEHVVIISTIGAMIGIGVLTLGGGDGGEKDQNTLLGAFIIFVAAVFQSLIWVTVRFISMAKIHPMLRPCYVGATILAFCAILVISDRSYMTFETWDIYDVILLSLGGVCCACCIGFQNIAFKYQLASKLAPLVYIENVFTLFADSVVFHYSFMPTDVIGITLIVLFLGIPMICRNR